MDNKPVLIYVYDPMCGWCYGFGPVIKQIESDNVSQLNSTVISGGMVVGDREGPIEPSLVNYILSALPRVEEYSGEKFGKIYIDKLQNGSHHASSVKPSIALVVFKSMSETSSIAFAHALQKALFFEGKDLNDDNTYKEIIKPFGIDENVFIERLNDPAYKTSAFEEFKQAAALGVNGYPSVILQKDGKTHVLSRGYTDAKTIQKSIDRLMK